MYLSFAFCAWFLPALMKSRHIAKEISDREATLKNLIFQNHRDCSTKQFIRANYRYGRSGNQFIEIVHGLWAADRTRRTLIIPNDVISDNPEKGHVAALG